MYNGNISPTRRSGDRDDRPIVGRHSEGTENAQQPRRKSRRADDRRHSPAPTANRTPNREFDAKKESLFEYEIEGLSAEKRKGKEVTEKEDALDLDNVATRDQAAPIPLPPPPIKKTEATTEKSDTSKKETVDSSGSERGSVGFVPSFKTAGTPEAGAQKKPKLETESAPTSGADASQAPSANGPKERSSSVPQRLDKGITTDKSVDVSRDSEDDFNVENDGQPRISIRPSFLDSLKAVLGRSLLANEVKIQNQKAICAPERTQPLTKVDDKNVANASTSFERSESPKKLSDKPEAESSTKPADKKNDLRQRKFEVGSPERSSSSKRAENETEDSTEPECNLPAFTCIPDAIFRASRALKAVAFVFATTVLLFVVQSLYSSSGLISPVFGKCLAVIAVGTAAIGAAIYSELTKRTVSRKLYNAAGERSRSTSRSPVRP